MSNYCVCCGEEIPEGRMVCLSCEADEGGDNKHISDSSCLPLYGASGQEQHEVHTNEAPESVLR